MTDAESSIRAALDGTFTSVAYDGTIKVKLVPLDWCPDYEALMRAPTPAENGRKGREIGGGRQRMAWSEEATAKFIALRLQRLTFRLIAAEFGCSESACTKHWEKLRDIGRV